MGAGRPVTADVRGSTARWRDRPRDERAVFTAVVYVLTSGCAWRHLPPTFGTSSATAHRRFTVWTGVGLWRRLHRAVALFTSSGSGSASVASGRELLGSAHLFNHISLAQAVSVSGCRP
ncbi:transposase [Streptomyces sp. NPDC002788]